MNLMTSEMMSKLRRWISEDKLVKFYKHRLWRAVRAAALKRDRNECQQCKAEGKQSKAETVHHIKEVRQFPELSLLLTNTVSLCKICHNKEHDKFGHKQNENKVADKIPERW